MTNRSFQWVRPDHHATIFATSNIQLVQITLMNGTVSRGNNRDRGDRSISLKFKVMEIIRSKISVEKVHLVRISRVRSSLQMMVAAKTHPSRYPQRMQPGHLCSADPSLPSTPPSVCFRKYGGAAHSVDYLMRSKALEGSKLTIHKDLPTANNITKATLYARQSFRLRTK